MNYLVTGATGFIGRFLVEKLLARRNATVYVLMRRASADRYEGLCQRLGVGEDRLIPVWGDITRRGVIDREALAHLSGTIDHVFHLAAVYDMNMTDAQADKVNNEGTANIVALAGALANESGKKPCFHHVSSVAVAGAEMILAPVNWPQFPRPAGEHPGEVITAMSTARLNRVAVAVCDRAGVERGQSWTGGTVIVEHGHGLSTVYSHLDRVDVREGANVSQGQQIGTVGSTGRSTGPHLDWRINWYQERLDPMLLAGPMPKN